MIVIDANVISELMRTDATVAVRKWADGCSRPIGTSVIAVMEVAFGIQRLPVGRRRDALALGFEQFREMLSGRLLPVSETAAMNAAVLQAEREAAGRRIEVGDALIAGTCLEHGAAVATRNVKDFEGLGIEVINPWNE